VGSWGRLSQFGLVQVLVGRLLADPVIAGGDNFRDAAAGALYQLGRPFRAEGFLSSLVDAALLRQNNAFPLPFSNK
jgi:hypothetical protein